jgi:hypothetical protein
MGRLPHFAFNLLNADQPPAAAVIAEPDAWG